MKIPIPLQLVSISKLKILTALLVCSSITFFQCTREEASNNYTIDDKLTKAIKAATPSGDIRDFILVDGLNFSDIPNQDPKNPINEVKVHLGKMLFHEPAIGILPAKPEGLKTFTCASCHIAEKAFTAGRFQGIADGAIGYGHYGNNRFKSPNYTGDEVDAQGARPLPVINLAYVRNALWAGSFGSFSLNEGTEKVWNQDTLINVNHKGLEGLEANNIRALQVHRMLMTKELATELNYKPYFDQAFPDIPEEERYTLTTTSFAIAAYFRTITTHQAPFQKWLKGDLNAMTETQKKGAIHFFGKAGCARCHNSPSLNSFNFFAVGVNDLYQSPYGTAFRTGPNDKRVLGRGGFTQNPEDNYKFKVPQLYNLKDVGFYFHGASKNSLRDVVEYFNKGIPENPIVPKSQISGFFTPLKLSSQEVDELTEFLENGLYDPGLARYLPDHNLSFLCFPNNDPQSRKDMGCN